MTRANKVFVVLVVLVLGLWGCAKNPANHASQIERVRALEGRCAKLEQDYRSAATARDQARKQASALEDETAQLRQELVKERDELRRRTKSVQVERDGLRQQLQNLTAQREELNAQLQQQAKEREALAEQLRQRGGERDALQVRCERLKRGLQELLQDGPAIPTVPVNGPSPTGSN